MKQGMRHHSSSITINYALALATMTKPDYFLIGTSLPTGICRAKTGGMDGRISIPRIARLYFSSDGERRHGLISFAKPRRQDGDFPFQQTVLLFGRLRANKMKRLNRYGHVRTDVCLTYPLSIEFEMLSHVVQSQLLPGPL
jgi:hypothetical protein